VISTAISRLLVSQGWDLTLLNRGNRQSDVPGAKQLILDISDEAAAATFAVTTDPKKCGVRWQYDRCLRDLLIHLYEWQVLMREFVQNIRGGHPRD
jgi:hypothetical protein